MMDSLFMIFVVVGLSVGLLAGMSVACVMFRLDEFAEKKPFEQKDKRQQKLVEAEVLTRNGTPLLSASSTAKDKSGDSTVSAAISQLPVDDVTEAISRQLSRNSDAALVGVVMAPGVKQVAPEIDDFDFDPDQLAASVAPVFMDTMPSTSGSDN